MEIETEIGLHFCETGNVTNVCELVAEFSAWGHANSGQGFRLGQATRIRCVRNSIECEWMAEQRHCVGVMPGLGFKWRSDCGAGATASVQVCLSVQTAFRVIHINTSLADKHSMSVGRTEMLSRL